MRKMAGNWHSLLRNNRTFADMDTDSLYILLLCFVSGMTQCLLTLCGIYMLLKHRNYQFQRIFAVVLILHGICFFNNFVVLACRHQPYSVFLNTFLVLFDYIIVGGYMMFAVSLVFPNRYKIHQLLLLEVAYIIALLLFAISRSPMVLAVVQLYTLAVSLALLVYLALSIRKYTRMLLDNVGDLEFFDLRWSNILIVLYFAFQLLWTIEGMSQQSWFSEPSAGRNLLFDTLYCFICIGIALYVMHKLIYQQVFTLSSADECENESQEPATTMPQPNVGKSLIGCDIDKVMKEKRYYLDNTLTLQKLAQHLGTNRQYLSNHINQELHTTFYDYINDFRLEEAKGMLDGQSSENQHSLEDIAMMAGFNSYATFLRSFKKKYGQTPSQYLTEKKT
ncbi:MAG: helix-turn-helix transcriptional regulator [Bacteroidales bacterium]|nr:helix-turn-helix transcriptional regulator [Bacteroidales bacterium]